MNSFQYNKSSFKRYSWIDALRGFAIILVVHFHVYGNISEYYYNTSNFIGYITSVVAPLRMPILVFLSGLLVSGSILKGGKNYFLGKIKNILYPYVVWTIIMCVFYFLRAVFLNKESTVIFWEALIVSPIFHLWFLYYIFAYYIITFFVDRYNCFFVFPLLVFIKIFFAVDEYDKFLSLYLFFLMGSYAGRYLNFFSNKIQEMHLYTLLLILVLAIISVVFYMETGASGYGVFYFFSALFFIPILIRLSMFIEGTLLSKGLEFLGKGSLVIYLAHVPLYVIFSVFIRGSYIFNSCFAYFLLFLLTMIASLTLLFLSKKYLLFSFLFSYDGFYNLMKVFRR